MVDTQRYTSLHSLDNEYRLSSHSHPSFVLSREIINVTFIIEVSIDINLRNVLWT